MAYFLSPALAQLRAEVNTRWPGRDRTSDGWIGDAAHSSRISDHNPDADGSVNALDVDVDGIDRWALVQCAMGDRRTNYIISNGSIYRRANDFRAEAYSGINGHYKHVHVSILHGDRYEDDRSPWGIAPAGSVSNPTPGPRPSLAAPDVAAPAPLIPMEDLVKFVRITDPRPDVDDGIYLLAPGQSARHLTEQEWGYWGRIGAKIDNPGDDMLLHEVNMLANTLNG